MHTTILRKVGGSVMLAVPPVILDMLDLKAGATVGISVENGQVMIEPKPRPHYTIEELLAQCDPSAPPDEQDRAWIDSGPVGGELI